MRKHTRTLLQYNRIRSGAKSIYNNTKSCNVEATQTLLYISIIFTFPGNIYAYRDFKLRILLYSE